MRRSAQGRHTVAWLACCLLLATPLLSCAHGSASSPPPAPDWNEEALIGWQRICAPPQPGYEEFCIQLRRIYAHKRALEDYLE